MWRRDRVGWDGMGMVRLRLDCSGEILGWVSKPSGFSSIDSDQVPFAIYLLGYGLAAGRKNGEGELYGEFSFSQTKGVYDGLGL